jgi:hypothetical protein
MRFKPIRIASLDGRYGRKVEASIDPLHGFRNYAGVCNVSLDEFYAWRLKGDISGRQVIENPNALPAVAQGVYQVRPDETASSGHKIFSHNAVPDSDYNGEGDADHGPQVRRHCRAVIDW